MAAWRYEIPLLVLKKYFTRSLRSLVKYFSTLEEKFRISAPPCLICFMTAVAVFQQLCLGILCANIQRQSNIISRRRNAAYTSS